MRASYMVVLQMPYECTHMYLHTHVPAHAICISYVLILWRPSWDSSSWPCWRLWRVVVGIVVTCSHISCLPFICSTYNSWVLKCLSSSHSLTPSAGASNPSWAWPKRPGDLVSTWLSTSLAPVLSLSAPQRPSLRWSNALFLALQQGISFGPLPLLPLPGPEPLSRVLPAWLLLCLRPHLSVTSWRWPPYAV